MDELNADGGRLVPESLEGTDLDPDMYPGLSDESPAFDPARVAHSFAMKYGLREHLTYEQAMGLERDLTTHLRAWLGDPS